MVTWYRLLDSARNSLEVVSVARDYFATWTPGEIARLPAALHPGKLRDERDVEEFHSRLVEAYRKSPATGAELGALQRLTSFMVRAVIRISELSNPPSGGESTGGPTSPRSASSRRDH